jgi:hypothetical protein
VSYQSTILELAKSSESLCRNVCVALPRKFVGVGKFVHSQPHHKPVSDSGVTWPPFLFSLLRSPVRLTFSLEGSVGGDAA